MPSSPTRSASDCPARSEKVFMENATPKLTAAQKRRICRDALSPALLDAGFVYKYDKFIRVHPGQVCLMVGLSLRRGFFDIYFGAVPLVKRSVGDMPMPPKGPIDFFVGWSAEWVAAAQGKTKRLIGYGDFDAELFKPHAQVFLGYVFDDLNRVTDVESFLHYAENVLPITRPFDCWGPAIQSGQYEKAEKYLRAILNLRGAELTRTQEKLRESDPVRYEAFLRRCVEETQTEIDDYRRILDCVEARNTEALNAVVQECIAVNEAPLRASLPQFFH